MTNANRKRLAVVVQRYGAEVNGGAESAARWLAENLMSHLGADVQVLTSCANDYTTWQNVYPAGHSNENGVAVHRFKVDAPRDWQRSQTDTGRFLLKTHTLDEEIAWIRRQGPFCSDLIRHVATNGEAYDAFFFFTYLYASTYFTLPLVAHKAILAPAAHDEPFLYLDAYRALLHMPRHIVYLTSAEKELVQRVSGNTQVPSTVIAIGIEGPRHVDGARFRARYGLEDPFLLYGGRLSEAKNVPQLLAFFRQYRDACRGVATHGAQPLKLALMGRAHMPLPDDEDVVLLGFLSEEEKFDALRAATAVILPSQFESLSIMILEAWLVGTPVLVNGRSAVLRRQVQESNGGLYYTSYEEFEQALTLLLTTPTLRRQLGRQGKAFVKERYDSARTMARYSALLEEVGAPS